MTRILVTGAREWTDRELMTFALNHWRWMLGGGSMTAMRNLTLVHGAADGADAQAATFWTGLGGATEPHPAREHQSPRARNRHMVDLGADLCLAFALKWASGTGMCARMARRAGIRVVDYGVDTSPEARPG